MGLNDLLYYFDNQDLVFVILKKFDPVLHKFSNKISNKIF